jgi:DUF1680 family protein
MRSLASLGQYVATTNTTGIQIHLYNSATIKAALPSGNLVALKMDTTYPWYGLVKFKVEETDGSRWSLRMRKPGWCQEAQVIINGQPVNDLTIESGYALLERAWQTGDEIELELATEPRLFEAHPRIDAVRDSVAIQYGPLIYCLEAADVDANLLDVRLDENTPLKVVWRDDLLTGGIMVVETSGYVANVEKWQDNLYRPLSDNNRQVSPSQTVSLRAIPYYAWGNRKQGAMRVWIPRLDKG